jgi:hypothetical protein
MAQILVTVIEQNKNDTKLSDVVQNRYDKIGQVSDGYHTFDELYHYRALYNAAFFNQLYDIHRRYASNIDDADLGTVPIKSWRHSDGEYCFGGGWFIVMVNLPTGQISNHYEAKYWDMFQISEAKLGFEWDGHTPQEAAERLEAYLKQ